MSDIQPNQPSEKIFRDIYSPNVQSNGEMTNSHSVIPLQNKHYQPSQITSSPTELIDSTENVKNIYETKKDLLMHQNFKLNSENIQIASTIIKTNEYINLPSQPIIEKKGVGVKSVKS